MEDQGENQNNNKMSEKVKNKAKKEAKKRTGKIVRAIVAKVVGVLATFVFQFWPIILIGCIIAGIIDYAVEITTAQNTPENIISQFEVENVADLIEIKDDGKGGYYLGFADDFDEKADAIVEKINSSTDSYNLPSDSEFLKKIIKAEVITQFPDLGGSIPDEDSDGFQGSVKIRRVSPDKSIGELKNTGAEGAVPLEEDEVYDTTQVGSYDEIIKNWGSGKKLLIKADAKVYKQTESELNPGSDTGNWEELLDDTGRVKIIPRGTEVEYTGTYKNNTNALTGRVITYVEVKYEDENIYVRANYLSEKQEQTDQESEEESQGQAKATSVAKVTSRARDDKEEVGGTKDSYVVAIAAGHNNTDDTGARSGDLVEENLTVEVAQKVQELIEDRFSNVTVVQTGSTPDNRGGIGVGDRKELARNANPDLCIQIHFNSATSADGNGVEVIYKEGDGISQQLAEILTNSISSSMGLENRGAGPDTEKCNFSLGIIENAATSGFPSVVTEGGFLSGNVDADVIRNGGVDKYAEGIVNGIKEYLEADHSGYSATATTDESVSEGINSIVKNLKYVPFDTMEQYIADGNTEALNVFSLDEDRNLITATWSYTGGKTEIRKNSPMNLKTALQKYVMPYEYLLFFYIDTEYEDFSTDLADEIINDTEIVMTVQDNVTTTQTVTTHQEKREDDKPSNSYDWRDTGSETEITENCSTSVDLTYVNTWCVKAYQENSYSSEILNMGDNETKQLVIKGKVNDNNSSSLTNEDPVVSDSYQEEVSVYDDRGIATGEKETITYNYTVYNRDKIDTRTISNNYEPGDLKTEGKENVFVDLYNKHNMNGMVRPDYLFTILENNERTANMLDLTKYLMFKATNINYGVIEYDFSEYNLSNFSSMMGGFYGNTIQEKVWWALIDAGYSKEAAAGVLGNIQAESGFDPAKIEYGSGAGYGLCQWTNDKYGTGRRSQLEAYAASKGVEPSDLDTQIEFLLAELTPGGGANGYATYQPMRNHGYTVDDWKNASTPEDAATAFCWTFERPKAPKMSDRTSAARSYYEQFKDATRPTGGSTALTQAADNVARFLEENNYTYAGTSTTNYTFPIANSRLRTLSCSSYIQECLLQAGYSQAAGGEKLWARSDNKSAALADFRNMGINVELITDLNALQPGDILQFGSSWPYGGGYHVVMVYNVSGNNIQYKGVGEVLNSGSGFDGETHPVSWFQRYGCYAIRIIN